MFIVRRIFNNVANFIKQREKSIFYSSLRKKYIQSNITIISNTCIGGIVYNQLGLRFNSPTINLWIEMNGFLSFCKDIEPYLEAELEEIKIGWNHPTGIIRPKLRDPIIIHFNHYNSFEEGKNKWNERKKEL